MDGWVKDRTELGWHPVDCFVCEEEIARTRAQATQQHFKKCLKTEHTLSLQSKIYDHNPVTNFRDVEILRELRPPIYAII